MTVVSIHLEASRALVAADTLLYTDDASAAFDAAGHPREASKVLALPHARCVLTSRGSSRLLPHLFSVSDELLSFDQACDALRGGLLKQIGARANLRDPARQQYPGDELYIVGWSDKLRRVACIQFATRSGFEEVQETALEGGNGTTGFYGPRLPPFAPLPRDAESMLACVRSQIELARKQDPAAPYGGDCIVAELTERGAMLRNMGTLGFPTMRAPARESGLMQIASEAASAISAVKQTGASTVYLTETTILTASITSIGSPIYLSATVDADGSYSARDATLRLKVDGTTVVEKIVTGAPDTTAPGNPWLARGTMLQYVVPSPSAGSRGVTLTAVGSHATYGCTIANADLYCEEKRR